MVNNLMDRWTIDTKYYTADVSLWMAHLRDDIYLILFDLSFGVLGFICFQKARSVRHCAIQGTSNSSGSI